jgi:hypothetical protein
MGQLLYRLGCRQSRIRQRRAEAGILLRLRLRQFPQQLGCLRMTFFPPQVATKRLVRTQANKYPPAEPEVLRLLAPQRGLTAIGHSQNPNTGDGVLQYPGNVKLWESPRQSRGFSPIK